MEKSKKIIKTILVLPLVLGLFFSWGSARQNQPWAQTASLVATVRINPLEVEVTAPSPVSLGERFRVEAVVKNLGETRIKKTKVELFWDPGLSLRGNPVRKMGVILGKESKTASWRITAEETGSYVILVEASGIEGEGGDLVEASDTTIVQVMKELTLLSKLKALIFSLASRSLALPGQSSPSKVKL